MANRLTCIEAGFSPALMTVYYEGYFRWLLSIVDGYIDRGRQIPTTDELVEAYKKLSGVLDFSRRWLCVWTGQYLSGHTTLPSRRTRM